MHGNHENRPQNIEGYELAFWYGAAIYIEPEYPSLILLKNHRYIPLTENQHWYSAVHKMSTNPYVLIMGIMGEDEQPSDETKQEVEASLEVNNWTVDTVLSHTYS